MMDLSFCGLCCCIETRKDKKREEEEKSQQNNCNRQALSSYRSSLYTFSKEPQKIVVEQLPSEYQQFKRILLVGKAGVGKTKLFNEIIGPQRKQYKFQHFTETVISNYLIVDTPGFEMENTIDERENTIKQFQDYLSKSKEYVSILAIVVNFERTDLMKKKVSEVYKFLHKFKEMIILIVVGWELNDNPDVSEDSLRHSFRVYPCDMIFIRKDQVADAVNAISKIVQSKPKQPMDLNNTIFEDFDPKALDIQEILGRYSLKIEQDV